MKIDLVELRYFVMGFTLVPWAFFDGWLDPEDTIRSSMFYWLDGMKETWKLVWGNR